MQDAQKSAAYRESEHEPTTEMDEPRWSVISFARCEASHLTFADAARRLSELEAAGIAGLCLVTDDAAERLSR